VTFTEEQRAVVVDASAAIPFLQGDPDWVARWTEWTGRGDMFLVPPHFPLEVANGLLRGTSIRSVSHVLALVRSLFSTGFEVADRGLGGVEAAIRLADQHALTVYDAAYLDLALEVDGELATLDGPLRVAAEAESVAVIG